MQILDGKTLSEEILTGLKERLSQISAPRPPKVAFLRVGDDAASVIYVNRKCRVAKRLGIETEVKILSQDTPEEVVFQQLEIWNQDSNIDGILVQAPLPNPRYQQHVFERISPEKDIDGFHPINFGKLSQENSSGFIACTPKGILRLLRHYEIPLAGKHVVIIGRSLIVGRPLSLLFSSLKVNSTVTLCHSRTYNIKDITLTGDVIISAIGKPDFLKADMVKDGAVVVDVGINRVDDLLQPRGYRIQGDADYERLREKCSAITPVPGGVGPMTIAMLMENIVEAYEKHLQLPTQE